MRRLTITQFDKLATIAIQHPNAKVVGWFDKNEHFGPIVSFAGKGLKYVNHNGRVNKLA